MLASSRPTRKTLTPQVAGRALHCGQLLDEIGHDTGISRNYRYRWLPRRSGLPRLIEAPKARLKEIQRWVLHEILDHVPPHGAAHGFTRGRSVLTHAAVHTGQSVVLRLDLRDFFASVSAGRVYRLFRAVGYGHSVAHALTGLCANTIPMMIWNPAERPTQPWLIQPHFWLGDSSRPLTYPRALQPHPRSPTSPRFALTAGSLV